MSCWVSIRLSFYLPVNFIFWVKFNNLKLLLETVFFLKPNRDDPFMFYLLLLLLFFQRAPFLHQVTVETWLLSFLLLQVDASDEASSIQLYLMLFFVTERQTENIMLFYTWRRAGKRKPASNQWGACLSDTVCSCWLTLGCSRLMCLQKHPTQTQTSCHSGDVFSGVSWGLPGNAPVKIRFCKWHDSKMHAEAASSCYGPNLTRP